jgi:hypothetical protein
MPNISSSPIPVGNPKQYLRECGVKTGGIGRMRRERMSDMKFVEWVVEGGGVSASGADGVHRK